MNVNTVDRTSLLLQMHRRRFDDIDRHIRVVWQSIGSVMAAIALLAVAGRHGLSLDLAVALVVLLSAWSSAQVIDASYWYNRNTVIIANIEREFLHADDVTLIHGYFRAHRVANSMISYLTIQLWLSGGLVTLVIAFHALALARGVLPVSGTSALPYLVGALALALLMLLRSHSNRKYTEFVRASPGRDVLLGADDVWERAER